MDVRNVQKSGNMFSIYLPSKWCKQKGISVGSRIGVDVDSSGNLVLSTKAKAPDKKISISLNENDLDIISKVVMGCFLNPVSSFEIDLTQKLNHKELLKHKKLITTTLIEVDNDKISSEPIITIDNPLSVFVVMVNKAKALVKIMIDDYDAELVSKFEDEIDWSNTMINKAVIASFMHKREAKRKLVELHYLSLISNYLERAIDRIISFEDAGSKNKKFLNQVYKILDVLYSLAKAVQSNSPDFNYNEAVYFVKQVKALKVNPESIKETLTHKSLRYCSEVLLDWTITNHVGE